MSAPEHMHTAVSRADAQGMVCEDLQLQLSGPMEHSTIACYTQDKPMLLRWVSLHLLRPWGRGLTSKRVHWEPSGMCATILSFQLPERKGFSSMRPSFSMYPNICAGV